MHSEVRSLQSRHCTSNHMVGMCWLHAHYRMFADVHSANMLACRRCEDQERQIALLEGRAKEMRAAWAQLSDRLHLVYVTPIIHTAPLAQDHVFHPALICQACRQCLCVKSVDRRFDCRRDWAILARHHFRLLLAGAARKEQHQVKDRHRRRCNERIVTATAAAGRQREAAACCISASKGQFTEHSVS